MELKLKNVSKTIRNQEILKGITVTFSGGSIYGVIGRNGSGKTMMFRAISGLMRTKGEIWLDDRLLGRDMKILPDLGLIIENTEMYPEFSGYTNLKLLADINKKIGKREIMETMERVGLDPHERKIVKKYSLGMRQKLAIAQAIMESPRVLLLDEPTNGLDNIAVQTLYDILLHEKEKGTLILLASHSRDDIAELADEVYVMQDGMLSREERG